MRHLRTALAALLLLAVLPACATTETPAQRQQRIEAIRAAMMADTTTWAAVPADSASAPVARAQAPVTLTPRTDQIDRIERNTKVTAISTTITATLHVLAVIAALVTVAKTR